MKLRIFCDKRLVCVFTSFTRATPICSSRNGMLRRLKAKSWYKSLVRSFSSFSNPSSRLASSPTQRGCCDKSLVRSFTSSPIVSRCTLPDHRPCSYAGQHHENSDSNLGDAPDLGFFLSSLVLSVGRLVEVARPVRDFNRLL
jgi:hypothetical protein